MSSQDILNIKRIFGKDKEISPLLNTVLEYKESLQARAEDLILNEFPEIIVKLNDVLKTPQFCNRKFADFHQDVNIAFLDPIVINSNTDLPPAKKTKFDNSISQDGVNVTIFPSGNVPSNKNVLELIEIAKPHIRKLVEDSNLLKMWIIFMIPKIQDGNNFGVSIQEETFYAFESAEGAATGYYEYISRYFNARGKLMTKVIKHPHLEDYRLAVQELDEQGYLNLWYLMVEMRNRYCILQDLVMKNLDKIKEPRPTNVTELLY